LLASVTEAKGHRYHADDHCQSRHDDWAEASGSRFDRGDQRISVMEQSLFGKGNDQDAVRSGDSHAHDCTHQSGNAECGVRDEEK
jgi:hypothetical protein